MKKINLFILCVLTCLMSSACNQYQLSCDEDINEWAVVHKEFYSKSGRSAIVGLPLSRQIAIYISLSPTRKAELWQDKINGLIVDGRYSKEEVALFHKIKDIIGPELFQGEYGDTSVVDRLDQEAKACLGDNTDRYFYAVCTWMTKEEYLDAVLNDTPVLTRIDGPGDEPRLPCTCRHDIGCFGNGGDCIKGGCRIKPEACGFLGQYDCNGLCD